MPRLPLVIGQTIAVAAMTNVPNTPRAQLTEDPVGFNVGYQESPLGVNIRYTQFWGFVVFLAVPGVHRER